MHKYLMAGLFTSFAIFILGLLSEMTNLQLLIAPFGASCVLLFGFPESPLVKNRNLVFGHLLSSAIGIIFLEFTSGALIPMAVATGVAVSLMMVTNTAHPAAGANPILIMKMKASWAFLLSPILAGVIILVMLSFIHRRFLLKINE